MFTLKMHCHVKEFIQIQKFTDQYHARPGADPGIWERGGTTYCFFRSAASLKTRASPKKADKRGGGGGGGTPTLFFQSAIYVGGGGGG